MLLRTFGWKFWIRFVLACSFVQAAEIVVHKFSIDHSDQTPFADTLLVLSGAYNRIVAAPRPPVARHTTLVEISPAHDTPTVSAQNVCTQRAFLARLLARIDEAGARVVVIDKYFGSNTCPHDEAATKMLQTVVGQVRTRRPVVIGLVARPTADEQRNAASVSHYLADRLTFPPASKGAQEGLINLSHDTRRLPLQWVVLSERAGPGASRAVTVDALALAASRLADPHLFTNSPQLSRLLRWGEQPYVSLLSPAHFRDRHYFASEVVCGRRLAEHEDWRGCEGELPPPHGLRGRVIVVGENNADLDQHWTAIGRLPGFYLQASYIEALLDDRLYRPAGRIADVLGSLLILFLVEVVLALNHNSLWKGVILSFGLLAGFVGLVYLIVVHTGYYLDPFLITGIAVAMKLLHPLMAFAGSPLRPEPQNRKK